MHKFIVVKVLFKIKDELLNLLAGSLVSGHQFIHINKEEMPLCVYMRFLLNFQSEKVS